MALHMFAEELEIEHPIEPDVDSIVRKVLNWSDDWQTKIDEAPKKALARKLMNLDAYWLEKIQSDQGIGHHNVNFGLCARQLDIQGKSLVYKTCYTLLTSSQTLHLTNSISIGRNFTSPSWLYVLHMLFHIHKYCG